MSNLSHHYHHDTYHHDSDVELTYLESFSFLFKSVWRSLDSDQASNVKLNSAQRFTSLGGTDDSFERYRLNVVDTILFCKGRPFRWLFTSEQTHEVLKKKDDKLDTFQIVKILKEKSKKLCVHKELLLGLRMKIANIWHIEPDGSINCHLVDEIELAAILDSVESNIKSSIVAVQVYIAGQSMKGNGVFEHIYSVDFDSKKPAKHHETFELGFNKYDMSHRFKCVAAGPAASTQGGKYRIIETPHNMLLNATKNIVGILERTGKVNVSKLVLQFAFNNTWQPYLIACSEVKLFNTPPSFSSVRSSVIFASGSYTDAPTKSLFNADGSNNSHTAYEHVYTHKRVNDQPPAADDLPSFGQSLPIASHYELKDYKAIPLVPEVVHVTNGVTTGELPADSKYTAQIQSLRKLKDSKKKDVRRPLSASITMRTVQNRDPKTGVHLSHLDDGNSTKRYMMYTEATKKQMLVLSNEERQAEKFDYFASTYKHRRPITAPHVSKDPDVAFRKYEEQYNLTEKEIRQLNRVVKPPPDTGFTIRCAGEYCFFIQNIYDSDVDRFTTGSSDMIRKIPYKSIVLAREEAKVVGCRVGDDKQAIMWQSMKNNVEEDQAYAYFARNQMTRVAKKCNEELTFATLMGLEKPVSKKDSTQAWDSMNTIYRRLIYADAIGSCQFTEFYRTVPVCSSCYKLYMFLDHQRVKLVLHNDDMDYDGKYTLNPKTSRYTKSKARTGSTKDVGHPEAWDTTDNNNVDEDLEAEEMSNEDKNNYGDAFDERPDNDKTRSYKNKYQEKIDSKLEFMPSRGSNRSSMVKLPSRYGDKTLSSKQPPGTSATVLDKNTKNSSRKESYSSRGNPITMAATEGDVSEETKRPDRSVTPNLVPVSLSSSTKTDSHRPVSIALVKGQGGSISSYVKMLSQDENVTTSRPQSASATMKSRRQKVPVRNDASNSNRPSSASAIKQTSNLGLFKTDDLFNFPMLQAAPLLPIAHELSVDSLSTIEDSQQMMSPYVYPSYDQTSNKPPIARVSIDAVSAVVNTGIASVQRPQEV